MKKLLSIVSVFFILSGFLISESLEESIDNMSREELQSVVEFLSHDLVEGRAPGTRGGLLSEIYMKSLFKFMGLPPGEGGSYLQPFTLKGFTVKQMELEANNINLGYPDDLVGTFTGEDSEFEFEADAVFAGFGINAPLWRWDDFKGVDVKGKFLIVRVNDPGLYRPDKFEGKALTYFGRWTYHIEEAARRGAAGILLIHTGHTAGYGWYVVQNSWSGEELFLPSDLDNNLKFRGWVKEESLKKILRARRIDLEELYRQSLKKRFKPIDLGFKIKVKGERSFREVLNHNVVAQIPGKSSKRIVLSAHIDHFGIGRGSGDDNIYNGAIDNGTAVAAMVLTAKMLKKYQQDLHYTITLLACNAEEAGMLGSMYYVRNTDRSNIIANINFESTPVWEEALSVMGVGARFSTLEDMLGRVVAGHGLKYGYFSMTDQGFFFRSDQFPFARHNIPALWISAGEDDASGERKYNNFWKTKYHTVKDEYDPDWPLGGLKQTVKYALLLIDYMNKNKIEPKWKRQLTFPVVK